ncbi:MAG TPA: GDSL-type esterase/lipase family protein [Opitutales bacterium]|nr:GDSL-type esterase/lipase family protein [Opitutales bacterium]
MFPHATRAPVATFLNPDLLFHMRWLSTHRQVAIAAAFLTLVPLSGLAEAQKMPEPYAGHQPFPPWNENGKIAHQQLVEKAKQGTIDVYFEGDSITRRWGATDYPEFLANWNENFHGWNCADFAWGGDSTHQILWRLQNGEFDGVHPKVIVLLAGANNIGRGERPGCAEDAAEGVEAIVGFFREKAPDATIILTALFPRNDSPLANPLIRQVNERIKKLADGVHVRWLDMNSQLVDVNGDVRPEYVMEDHLHPSIEGYKVWAKNLVPILEELLGPRAEVDLAPPPTGDPSVSKNKDLAPDIATPEKPSTGVAAPVK